MVVLSIGMLLVVNYTTIHSFQTMLVNMVQLYVGKPMQPKVEVKTILSFQTMQVSVVQL